MTPKQKKQFEELFYSYNNQKFSENIGDVEKWIEKILVEREDEVFAEVRAWLNNYATYHTLTRSLVNNFVEDYDLEP